MDPSDGRDGGALEKVELLERVEDGVTGPSDRNEAAKSGSLASLVMDASLLKEAWDWGWTAGPGAAGWPAGGGGVGGMLEDGDWDEEDGFGGSRVGYWRRAEPAAAVADLAAVLEAEEPIVGSGNGSIGGMEERRWIWWKEMERAASEIIIFNLSIGFIF